MLLQRSRPVARSCSRPASADGLVAPNTDAAYEEIEPALRTFLNRLYAGAPYTLVRESDPKERLCVRAQVDGEVPLNTLLERLA